MKDKQEIKLYIPGSGLKGEHASRGIGTYTRLLIENLKQFPDISLTNKKYNLVHYTYFDFFSNTLPIHLFKKSLVTIHDVIPLVFPKYYKPGLRGALKLKKQRFALKYTKAIITDSEHSKTDIQKYLKIPEKKIFVVPLAANPELVLQSSDYNKKIKKDFNLPDKYILYVGDVNYNKNIPQLIKTLKFLPEDVHLVLVGKNFYPHSIPEWQWIETQIALSNVENRVHFITTIKPEQTKELSAVFNNSICYVQPSLYEGFGLPVLEAMQCRTAVVTTNESSLPEVGGIAALYAQPTAEDLAEKITEVLSWNQAERRRRIQAAYEWSQTFSWEKTAEMMRDIYLKILKT